MVPPLHCTQNFFYTQGMTNLSYVTSNTKKLLKWGAITIVALIIIVFIIRIIGAIIKANTPPPPPTVSFGKIPPVTFPQSTITQSFSYELNTLTGTLPAFPDRAILYKIVPIEPTLLSFDRAQDAAVKLGFHSTGIRLSENTYQWIEQGTLTRNLKFDIFSYNFELLSDFLSSPDVANNKITPDKDAAQKQLLSFLGGLPIPPTDIDATRSSSFYLSLSNGALSTASSPSNSQIVRIDLAQTPVDGIPIYYPHPPETTMTFLLAPANNTSDYQIVQADYTHQTIDMTQSATYPIITAQQAYNQLKKGQAFIASYYGTSNTISITDVKLGYYLGKLQQQYLYPIYVFEGENGFFAYVPAITSTWIQPN